MQRNGTLFWFWKHVCALIPCIILLVWVFVSIYLRLWMYWHLGKTFKHSGSIEQAPMSSPTPLSPTELTTKARASISSGNSRMLRSSRVGLAATRFLASCWSWLSWRQRQSSSICKDVRWQNQQVERPRRLVSQINYKIVCQVLLLFILPWVQSGCCYGTCYIAVSEQELVVFWPSFELLFLQTPWLIELRQECSVGRLVHIHISAGNQWRRSSGLTWSSNEFSDWIWQSNGIKVKHNQCIN